jgi:SAM-dependent MidA family methyltransferase
MGIQYRLAQIAQKLKNTPEDEKTKNDLIKGYKRLCDPMDMGKLFKFMAISNIRSPPLTFE